MLQRIVVPLDGSPFGEQALPAALGIAQRDHATVEIVHVYESLPSYRTQGAPALDPALDEKLRKDRQAYLVGIASRLRRDGKVQVEHALLDGPVSATLADHIAARHADLVVMTTHGHSGLSRMWLGSTAIDMVRRLDPPVLLVRPGESGAKEGGGGGVGGGESRHVEPAHLFGRTLIPLDGSPAGEAAIDHATAITGGAGAFVLLHVMLPLIYFAAEPNSLVYPGETEMREAAERYLERVAARLRVRGMDVETTVIRHSRPAQAIVDFAESSDVALIAMETHARTGMARVLMGSVADKIVRAASVPVLLHRSRVESTPATGEQAGELMESSAPRR